MKKKNQMIMWVILLIIVSAILGLIITNIINAKTKKIQNPVATFEIENVGNIKIELYPEYAPNTVANFINLINKGYYNGKTFYGKDINAIYAAKTQEGEKVEPTMSLVDSNIKEGSEHDLAYQIKGEFVANGFEKNVLKHEKGVVSMVREDYPAYFGIQENGYNSASGSFQIMLDTNRNLNGLYTAFGKVVEGLDVVEKIFDTEQAKLEEDAEMSMESILDLATPAIIKNVTVETYGVDYGMPEIHEAFNYDTYMQDYLNSYTNQ